VRLFIGYDRADAGMLQKFLSALVRWMRPFKITVKAQSTEAASGEITPSPYRHSQKITANAEVGMFSC
jgi:hypothetical protein